jgi:hypothetical protein
VRVSVDVEPLGDGEAAGEEKPDDQ